jgi:hypothetical protein
MRFTRLALTIAALFLLFPTTVRADKVLIIGSGDMSNEQVVQALLQTVGDTVTIGPTYNNYTGTPLGGYNEVVLMPGGPAGTPYSASTLGDMPTSGQQALLNFVATGGGLITSEAVIQKYADQHGFQTLYPALPVTGDGTHFTIASPITYSALTNDQVVNAYLPSSFSFKSDSAPGTLTYAPPKPGATPFFSTNGPVPEPLGNKLLAYGVVGWNYGLGRVMNFSTYMDNTALADHNFAQLVSNALAWSGGDPASPLLRGWPPYPPHIPEPAAAAGWGTALVCVAVLSWARRRKGLAT